MIISTLHLGADAAHRRATVSRSEDFPQFGVALRLYADRSDTHEMTVFYGENAPYKLVEAVAAAHNAVLDAMANGGDAPAASAIEAGDSATLSRLAAEQPDPVMETIEELRAEANAEATVSPTALTGNDQPQSPSTAAPEVVAVAAAHNAVLDAMAKGGDAPAASAIEAGDSATLSRLAAEQPDPVMETIEELRAEASAEATVSPTALTGNDQPQSPPPAAPEVAAVTAPLIPLAQPPMVDLNPAAAPRPVGWSLKGVVRGQNPGSFHNWTFLRAEGGHEVKVSHPSEAGAWVELARAIREGRA